VIYSGDKSKARVVGRFAPKANPEYQFKSGESEIGTLVATDVLAEGLNLQDCNIMVNYDLHWNPVRLIQRFGRIDRIGTGHDEVFGFNFLPESGIERNLGLRQVLKLRIQEIHDTIGEDAKILDDSERLNEEAMYAIYETKAAGQLDMFAETDSDAVDLNQAEEFLQQLRREKPEEFERIASMRDGIRSAMASSAGDLYVFCQADNFQQLYLADAAGEIVSRDIPRILAAIRSDSRGTEFKLPRDFNAAVMRVKTQFDAEVKKRRAERKYSVSLTHGQRYVIRELRLLYEAADEENIKAQVTTLEKAFRGILTSAVRKEVNRMRLNTVTGTALLRALTDVYYQHGMKDWAERQLAEQEKLTIPRVVCSEKLQSG